MEKKIEVCIGTDRNGNVRARLSLMVVDSGAILSEQYHSANIEPGQDHAEVRAAVEAHLAMDPALSGIPGGPWPAIPDEEWAKVDGVVAVIQTPEVVEKTAARKLQALSKMMDSQRA